MKLKYNKLSWWIRNNGLFIPYKVSCKGSWPKIVSVQHRSSPAPKPSILERALGATNASIADITAESDAHFPILLCYALEFQFILK